VSRPAWLRRRPDQPERRARPWFLRPGRQGYGHVRQPATAWWTGLSLSGSGYGYRDRDRRDPVSELAMDTSLPSSGISSSPAR
jgi:hypothetical protein